MNWFKIYIGSSLHVAFAVCALVGITANEFDIKILKYFYFFIFFSTISGYNFVKFVSIYKSSKHEISLSLKVIQRISVIAALFFYFQLSEVSLVFILFLAILTFLYANPLHKNKNLRNLTGLKISIVSLVWASTTLILPILNENIQLLNKNVWLSFIQRFLFVFILTLPFEIRDLKFDDSALETLPQRVGVYKTKLIGTFLLIVVLILEFFKDEIDKYYLFSLALILPILFLFLLFSKKNEPKYYSSFWVESIPIVWYGLSTLIPCYFNIS
jgi:hypothetical protein